MHSRNAGSGAGKECIWTETRLQSTRGVFSLSQTPSCPVVRSASQSGPRNPVRLAICRPTALIYPNLLTVVSIPQPEPRGSPRGVSIRTWRVQQSVDSRLQARQAGFALRSAGDVRKDVEDQGTRMQRETRVVLAKPLLTSVSRRRPSGNGRQRWNLRWRAVLLWRE